MSKVVTIEEVKNRLREIHGDIISIVESAYTNTQTKCCFVDKDYGEFWAFPYNIFRGDESKIRTINKQRSSIQQIKDKIKEIHEDTLVLDESTYVVNRDNMHTKCRFIDKDYGEWWARLCDVLNQEQVHPQRALKNRELTCLEKYGARNVILNKEIRKKADNTILKKYGVTHATKNRDILLKALRRGNKTTILQHWKTKEDVVCTASYEKAVVEWLNKTKQDFDWQIPFNMPNGKQYFIDLYLKDQDLWVEIKGYFYKHSKEKWDWFHDEYPNSQLWNEKKLKEMKLL